MAPHEFSSLNDELRRILTTTQPHHSYILGTPWVAPGRGRGPRVERGGGSPLADCGEAAIVRLSLTPSVTRCLRREEEEGRSGFRRPFRDARGGGP